MSKLTLELAARRNNKPTEFELKGRPAKPCPFCGESEIHVVEGHVKYFVWCSCTVCGCEGPARPNRATAIRAWQRRAGERK